MTTTKADGDAVSVNAYPTHYSGTRAKPKITALARPMTLIPPKEKKGATTRNKVYVGDNAYVIHEAFI